MTRTIKILAGALLLVGCGRQSAIELVEPEPQGPESRPKDRTELLQGPEQDPEPGPAQAAPEPEPLSPEEELKAVEAQVDEIVSALNRADPGPLLERMHPLMLRILGGPDKARTHVLATLGTEGLEQESLEFHEDVDFLAGTDHEFIFVPTRAILHGGGKREEHVNFMLGIRPRGTRDWTYIQGSRLTTENLGELFEDFPAKYRLPAISRRRLDP